MERVIGGVALALAWLTLSLLIGTTLLNVTGRGLGLGESATLYEVGGDLFFALVMLSFGHAYLRDGHVRIDIVRGRLRPRTVAWIEVAGCLGIVLPVSVFLVGYGADAARTALAQGERAFGDLPLRWLVKATVPLGFLLLLLAAACVTARNLVFLSAGRGAPAPEDDRALGETAGGP